MNIRLQQYNTSQYAKPHRKVDYGTRVTAPKIQDSISFGANPFTTLSTNASKFLRKKIAGGRVVYSNISEVATRIDAILGDDIVQRSIKQAKKLDNKVDSVEELKKFEINNIDEDFILLKKPSFGRDFLDTLGDLVFLPCKITRNVLEFASKKGPFKESAQNILNSDFIRKAVEKKEQKKSYEFLMQVLEDFSYDGEGENIDLDTCAREFQEKITSKILKITPNYNSRDERALNRMATSTVSALFAGSDFYNISMLQKDDKKEAEKSRMGRIKQDMSRMAISAGITFFSLGALNKHIKGTVGNAIIIAASALISEIVSRLIQGTPLVPLSSEQAVKHAQRKREKDAKKELKKAQKAGKTLNAQQQNNIAVKKQIAAVPFKSKMSDTNIVFGDFAQNGGSFAPLKIMTEQNARENMATVAQDKKPEKKKFGLGAKAGLAFASISALFLGARIIKGDYKALKAQKEFYAKHGAELEKIANGIVDEETIKAISSIKEGLSKIEEARKTKVMQKFKDFKVFLLKKLGFSDANAEKYSKAGVVKETLLNHEVEFDAKKVYDRLEEIKAYIAKNASDKDDASVKEITGVIDLYLENIRKISGFDPAKEKHLVGVEKDRNIIITSVYRGLSKTVESLYSIFSFPGRLVDLIIKIPGGKERKTIEKAASRLDVKSHKKCLKEIGKLADILSNEEKINLEAFLKTKSAEELLEESNKKAIELIKRSTRNFQAGSETGELATLSRTLVTMISTYFFVNDYRNKVLIESEGKDIQGANEELNERIAHKLANFVINGTLMNLFNSVFIGPLNGSLLGASAVAAATELTNETAVRKSICQPVLPQESKQAIIDFEEKQLNKGGFAGWWARTFRKITGKKSLTQKVGIDVTNKNQTVEKKQA